MFRHSSICKCLIALLLPLTFIGSWAACTALCSEITAHLADESIIKTTGEIAGNCSGLSNKTSGCPMPGGNAVVFQEKQTVINAPVGAVLSVLPFSAPHQAWSALLPETNQNSPPKLSLKPLFVRHCAFRI